jgi:general secretion pathway protein F
VFDPTAAAVRSVGVLAAQCSDRPAERRIAAFVALLEPLLILAMGGIVLVIVMAILLPIFELNSIIR